MRLFTAIDRMKAFNRLKASAFAAIAFFVLLLAGCGQKGDLYQPKTTFTGSDIATEHSG